ncbi:MAG: 2-oxoacid:acceptor oxidoreductase family protein, partial [Chitinivibrionales bacterium]|nr:2-oxoacid:acceptor oxidoreductase family protein [Chitinivibrionales bacterium]
MKPEINIRIAGQAGQGMQTVGAALCRIFKLCGRAVFAHQDYMSRVRGGNNFFQVRSSASAMPNAPHDKCDIIVALDKQSTELHRGDLAPDGIMIVDKEKFALTEDHPAYFNVPLYALAKNTGGKELFVNSVACGVLAGLLKIDFKNVAAVLTRSFNQKGTETVAINLRAATAGYDFAATNFKNDIFRTECSVDLGQLIMDGNEAVALGAISAGVKFYSAYPMTPSTTIMENIARYAGHFNIVVEQAEDEIAAIKMVLGAA